MEKKNDLEEMIKDSEKQFRDQFDPSHPTYHQGSTVQVPTGEQKRVPESMPTEYQQTQTVQNEDYLNDQDYKDCMEQRTKFQEIKKVMPKLCAPIEAMLRAKTKAADDEASQAKLKELIQAEKVKIEQAKDALNPYIVYFSAVPKYKEKYIDELQECIELALTKEFNDKDTLADFNFRVKRLSQAMFKEVNELLAEIKKIKQKYQNKESTQQPAEQQ